MISVDIVVVGAGMAGASVAARLVPAANVAVLEMESQPGYHTTGRSAATWIEAYGNDCVVKLNRASRGFLEKPDDAISSSGFTSPRGMLAVQLDWSTEDATESASPGSGLEVISVDDAIELVPQLRREVVQSAVYTKDAYDIDVNALHTAYLRYFRSNGGTLACDSEVLSVERIDGRWKIRTAREQYSAEILVNAAGAWAATMGAMAGSPCDTGLTPLRRSAAIVPLPDDIDCSQWPITADIDEAFYFKPESGQLMVSPADETPVEPHDAFPEDLDIATGIDRFQKAMDIPVPRLGRCWAGLRTFSRDRTPVLGFDPRVDGFFWLAGQGGYGIQTAPAMASLAAALLLDNTLEAAVADEGIRLSDLDPARYLPAMN